MALPPLHMLVGSACAEAGRKPEFPRYRAWIIGALVGMAADVPSAVKLLLGMSAEHHGLYSHTLFATALAVGAGAVIGGRRWALIFGTAYGSHLIVDLLRESGTTGVHLFSPIIMQPAQPLIPLLPHVPFDVFHKGSLFSLHGHQPYIGFSIQLGLGIVLLGSAVIYRHRQDQKRKEYIKSLVRSAPSRRRSRSRW